MSSATQGGRPPQAPAQGQGGLLVLLRHGQSEWNAAGLFTGWANPDLAEAGQVAATQAGALLAEHGLFPAFVHTSLLRRAIHSADLALAAADRDWIPVRRSWRLNSRHYGALQGGNKAQIRAEYGEEQFMTWRRSYDVPPPPIEVGTRHCQFSDPRYRDVPPEARPRAESLRDVTARLLPYWYDAIVPDLAGVGCVLVVSHGNTLRALVKHLEAISDDRIAELEIAFGIPLAYQLGPDMRPAAAGRYLDPGAAGAAIEAARNQGRTPRSTRPLRRIR